MTVAFDWQTAAVALIVLAALLYVMRRAWARLRSFTSGRRGSTSACATGCGTCGDEVKGERRENVLVQISSNSTTRQRKR